MMTEANAEHRLSIDDAEAQAYEARRRALHTAVMQLDADLDELATQQSPDRDRFATAVRSLQDSLEEHAREADAPDGLLAQILSDAPWFAARVQKLRDEHVRLRERATTLLDDAGTDRPIGELLPEARSLALQVSDHRHAGTILLLDAYMLDIPAGD